MLKCKQLGLTCCACGNIWSCKYVFWELTNEQTCKTKG